MQETKRGSAGGKKMSIIQKEQAKQRIDEYNKNPNICKCCGKPIIAPYNKKLREITIKKFCSQSCSAKLHNLGRKRNVTGNNGTIPLIEKKTDEEIISAFNNSKSIAEFGRKLGYKYRIRKTDIIRNKLESLGLNIEEIDGTPNSELSNLTKGELFAKYTNWIQARATIQKYAKNTYTKSHKPKYCVVCGYDKHYEVAHIKAVSVFDDNALISDIDHIDNLIALCPNHHWEYDNNNLDIQLYLDKINCYSFVCLVK